MGGLIEVLNYYVHTLNGAKPWFNPQQLKEMLDFDFILFVGTLASSLSLEARLQETKRFDKVLALVGHKDIIYQQITCL